MVDKEHFASLPVAHNRYADDRIANRFSPRVAYLDALDSLAEELHNYINSTVQVQENVVRGEYAVKLSDLAQKSGTDPKKYAEDEQDALYDFEDELLEIRNKRNEYRHLLHQVQLEKKKLLESMRVNRAEENYVRKKLNVLGSHLPESPDRTPRWSITSLIYILLLLLTIVIYLLAETFPWDYYYYWNNGTPNRIADNFLFFTHIALFVFVGFSLLNTFMRRYQYSGLGFSLLIASWAFLWTILWGNLWGNVNGGFWERDRETIYTIIAGLYGATALLVIFGAVMGRVTLFAILVITFFGTFWYSVNQFVTVFVLQGVDYGGPNHIWLFAASFGVLLAAFLVLPSRILHRHDTRWIDEARRFRRDRTPSYYSNVFAIAGTLIMFVTFPSFNGANAPDSAQFRVVINVIIALVSSVCWAFLTSYVFHSGKWNMIEIQRATLAGGIACSSAFAQGADPGGAMVLGAFAGIISVVGYIYFNPIMERRYGILDEAGVFSFAFLPALTGSIAGIIQTFLKCRHVIVYGAWISDYYPHSSSQAGFQAAILFISIGIGAGGGALTGLLVWLSEWGLARVRRGPRLLTFYSDESNWVIPSDFERTYRYSNHHHDGGNADHEFEINHY